CESGSPSYTPSRRDPGRRGTSGSVARDPDGHFARSLDQDVVTGPAVQDVLPQAADEDVVPGAAEKNVVARAADQDVVAVAAVLGQLDRAGRQAGSLHHVVAGQGVDDEPVRGRLGTGDMHLGSQTQDINVAGGADDRNGIAAGGAVDDDGVGRAVASAAAGRGREVDVHLGDAGAGEVVDGDRVGAAEGDDVDLLDAVDIHGHVADVAEQPQPAAVGRQVHV